MTTPRHRLPLRRASRRRSDDRRRTGAMLVLVAVTLFLFMIGVVFSVDISYMQLVRTEMRTATDAAARAGAEALAREQTKSGARKAARQSLTKNLIAGKRLKIKNNEILIGQATRQLDGSWLFENNKKPFNAVRIDGKFTTDSRSGHVDLFFGGFLGQGTFEPKKISTAAQQLNEVCFVIDRSHSMCFDHSGVSWSYPDDTPHSPDPVAYPPDPTESRWASLEEAINLYLDTTEEVDSTQRIAMVSFGSEITQSHYEGNLTGRNFPAVINDSGLTYNRQSLRNIVEAKGDDIMLGGTHMSVGMEAAIEVLTSDAAKPFAAKTMILLTDGQWNRGDPPRNWAYTARDAGIVIHTVTFLDQADQADMQEVARITGGRHYHASDTDSLKAAFEDLALSMPVLLTD